MSASSKPGFDRRSSTRVQLQLSTSLVLVKVDTYYSGAIANLSLGGCYFPIEVDLPLGELCQVEIALGEGLDVDAIKLSGKVARLDSGGAGIEFVDNPPEAIATLESILSRFALLNDSD